jgi:diguanylate cyclase (GGDEF)-like protein
LPLAFVPQRPLPAVQTLALVLMYAVLARVRFAVGSGFTMPTQLALVPIALLLPPAFAPAVVGAGLVLSRAPEVVARRAPATRVLTSIADGWYVVAPAVLLVLIAPDGALERTGWLVWVAALGLQLVGDLLFSTLRESLGAGVPPSTQVGVIAQIAIVDVLLSPVGLLAAFAAESRTYVFLLTLPLAAGLTLYARERAARIARALALIDELERERERVLAAQRRVGETAAANLDRPALERIIVAGAVELVGADAGRLSTRCKAGEPFVVHAHSDGASDLDGVLDAVAVSLASAGGLAQATAGDASAIAVRIESADVQPHVLAVARHSGGFSAGERELLHTLAEQAAVCLQNLALHAQIERLASTDELTGLLNHRRLQEVLEREVHRAQRYESELALVMLDIDDFKHVNDRYGHQQGDAVLRAVADAVKASVRSVDVTARYGGDELALALPNTEPEEALSAVERIRQAIAAVRVPAPGGGLVSVTASIGVAVLGAEASTRTQLIAAADQALYRAKRGGKNRVEHWMRLKAPACV